MRVLLDTDVILDLFLDRPGYADDAAAIWSANEQGRVEAFISAITPVNVFYVARKLKGAARAREAVKELIAALPVCTLDYAVLLNALSSGFADYEDAVQQASATANQLDAIVTRNTEDYKAAIVTILHPAELSKQLAQSSGE